MRRILNDGSIIESKTNAYQVVRDFEEAIADYTGAPFAVAVSSCTEALMLACAYWFDLYERRMYISGYEGAGSMYPESFNGWHYPVDRKGAKTIYLPRHTYVGVPMSVINAGGRVQFDTREWHGAYQLRPYFIWDSAKWLTSGLYKHLGGMVCISLHWAKTLSVGWGGVILHDSPEADKWLRKARFDGRTEGVPPAEDNFDTIGWHCMMSPAQAAEALTRLSFLPEHNDPIPNDGYPDLSKFKIFQ